MPQDFTAGQVLTAAQMDTLSGAVDGYATTATAAGTTVMTVASLYQQFFTGSTTQTVALPVASTLYVGWKQRYVNNSSGIVTVQSSGANTIYAVPAGGDVMFTCILASGTTAASWDYKNYKDASTAPGLTLITRASYSGVATTGTTFDSVFSATYKSYMVVIESHYAATGTDAMHMQFRYSATTQALTYYSTSRALDSATALASQAVSNGAQCVIHSASGSSAAPMSGALYFHQIGNGSSKPLFHGMGFVGIGNPGQFVFGGFQDTARSYDGFILKSASTNITGTISVYGLVTA